MGDIEYNQEEISKIMNRKIKIVRAKDKERYLNFRSRVLDIGVTMMNKFGIRFEQKELTYKELCYFGCFKNNLVAFDKITNNVYNPDDKTTYKLKKQKKYKYNVKPKKVSKKITFIKDTYEVKAIKSMIHDTLKHDTHNLDNLLDYFLYILGDKNFENFKHKKNEEDIEFLFNTFKPIPLLFFPSSYFMDILDKDYFGLNNQQFFNLNIDELRELLDNSNIKCMNNIYLKALLVECYLYAPQFIIEIYKRI